MPICTILYNGTEISASEQAAPVAVTYGGRTISTVQADTSKTLNCSGKYMTTNIVVGTKTLLCGGKLMLSDIIIRAEQVVRTVTLNLSGRGNATDCYASIGGTKRYDAGTYTVNAGDTITFGVYGRGSGPTSGRVTIDGVQVLTAISREVETYVWTVPECVSCDIAFDYSAKSYGRITVTTH